MGVHYTPVQQKDRDRIKTLHDEGFSIRKIAKTSGIPHCTSSREIRRNSYGTGQQAPPSGAGVYDPAYARRHEAKSQGKKLEHPDVRAFVTGCLRSGLESHEIAGCLKRHQGCSRPRREHSRGLGYISRTAIYDWLYSAYGQHLYSNRYRPRRRHHTLQRSLIPDRTGVAERPRAATSRRIYGHWEATRLCRASAPDRRQPWACSWSARAGR